ncbi:MAG: NUDIX hydrolase [Candidatus Omnitrophica bacterium]|nr:NUDIX hydrolase [Candidatus Omnitrophota bacterium]
MSEREVLYEGKYQRLVRQDGWEFIERVNCTDIVVILAVTEEKKILFVEQYRVPVQNHVIEFPAGLVGDEERYRGEELTTAAKRELLEETGYEAEQMVLLTKGPISSASIAILMSVYQAKGLKKVGPGGGDELESIIVHEVDIDLAEMWLRNRQKEGCLVDPKVYAGLYFLQKMES